MMIKSVNRIEKLEMMACIAPLSGASIAVFLSISNEKLSVVASSQSAFSAALFGNATSTDALHDFCHATLNQSNSGVFTDEIKLAQTNYGAENGLFSGMGIKVLDGNGAKAGVLCLVGVDKNTLAEQATLLGYFRDLIEQEFTIEHLESSLLKQSKTDSLTGVLNRKKGFECAQLELDRAVRYRSSFSVMMLDIDGMNAINVSHGHETGDVVLKTVATTICSMLRSMDVFVRYSGGKFLIVLPETDKNAALLLGRRICEEVEGVAVTSRNQQINVTASIGVGCYVNDTDISSLISKSDKALIRAKKMPDQYRVY